MSEVNFNKDMELLDCLPKFCELSILFVFVKTQWVRKQGTGAEVGTKDQKSIYPLEFQMPGTEVQKCLTALFSCSKTDTGF